MERRNWTFFVVLLLLGTLFWRSFGFNVLQSGSNIQQALLLRESVIKRHHGRFGCNFSLEEPRMKCHMATIKGRSPYQEDRILCNRHRVPFHGYKGTNVVKIDLVAVFDGHFGAEASHMASKYFASKLCVNAYYGNHDNYDHFLPWINHNRSTHESFCRSMRDAAYLTMEEANHFEILRRELAKTFSQIDEEFVWEAVKQNVTSGTTALVVLLVDGQILVANLGDSKALLCYEDGQSYEHGGFRHLSPKELTRDHNASRVEERARIEAAGGFIDDSKVPLVMGHFPLTRAIGDFPLKKYGIISEPEVTDWLPLSSNDHYLVVASHGIFERLTPKDICDLLSHKDDKMSAISADPIIQSAYEKGSSDRIIQSAYEKGSSENLSVVVVPLK